MKKIELGQLIQIVANLGVIAGIVFLAVELRQNNRLYSRTLRHLQHWLEGGSEIRGRGWREVADPDFTNFVEQCVLSECDGIPR